MAQQNLSVSTLEKTWHGGTTASGTELIGVDIGLSASSLQTHYNFLLWIKNALTGRFYSPWTVVGSSDTATAGMDGTDRWTDVSKVLQGSPGSWIVLQNTAIGPKFQILLGLRSSYQQLDYTVCETGFGSANGGTDGSISALPTGVDGFSLSGFISNWFTGTSTYYNCRVWHIYSTDGQCSRFISCAPTYKPHFLWCIDRVRNPLPNGWDVPWVIIKSYTTPNISIGQLRTNLLQDTRNYVYTRVPGDGGVLYRGSAQLTSQYSNYIQEGRLLHHTTPNIGAFRPNLAVFGANDLTGPANDGGARGYFGSMYDMFWLSEDSIGAIPAVGDTIPSTGEKAYVCLGEGVIGWLGDSLTGLVLP